MIILAKLTIKNNKSNCVRSGYRPDWVSDKKPEYNCAAVFLSREVEELAHGEKSEVILRPLIPDLWVVDVGDELKAMEGLEHIGTATVLKIFSYNVRDL